MQSVGLNNAYVCLVERDPQTTICEGGVSLTIKGSHQCMIMWPVVYLVFRVGVSCVRLSASERHTFSFSSFEGEGEQYQYDINAGQFSSDPYGFGDAGSGDESSTEDFFSSSAGTVTVVFLTLIGVFVLFGAGWFVLRQKQLQSVLIRREIESSSAQQQTL